MSEDGGETRAANELHLVSIEKAILIDLCLGVPLGAMWYGPAVGEDSGVSEAPEAGPDTFLFHSGQLRMLRELHRADDPSIGAGVHALCAQAERLLDVEAYSVTHKTEAPPSDDAHDYYSIGRYWWPDPAKPDGLPYVMRDGETNPESRSDAYDAARLDAFAESVVVLSLAAYVTGDDRFAGKAAELARAWFLRDETRQTPHFDFAQVIPGREEVPARGIVEARRLVYISEAIRLLAEVGVLSPEELAEIKHWFASLLEWMTSTQRLAAAEAADNNVAFWYELQCVAYADLTGDETLVHQRLGEVVPRRIVEQVADDGALPNELLRSQPTDYTAFTLLAMAELAQASESVGIDIWTEETAGGKAFSAATDWLRRIATTRDVEYRLRRLGAGREASPADEGPEEFGEGDSGQRLLDLAIALRGVEVVLDLPAREEQNREIQGLRQTIQGLRRQRDALEQATRSVRSQVVERERRIDALERDSQRLQEEVTKRDRKIDALKPDAPQRRVEESAPSQTPRPRPRVADMKAEHTAKGLDTEPNTFVLYRTIGNDLPPRHRQGQSRDNVRFILENEPPLEGCKKRWIVNRIFDPNEEAAIIELLERHEQPYIHLPFDWDEYRRVPWDFEGFPEPCFFLRGAAGKMRERALERAEAHVRRHKNNYVINVNGARNVALRDGRGRAKWVLPWDGNCFLTEPAWYEIAAAIAEQSYLKYLIVPMARITDNELLLDPSRSFEAQEEPQIIFRRDAGEQFDEAFPYGRRPKVELLWRLAVPGKWEGWHLDDSWDLPRPQWSKEAGQFAHAGWVARLFSGQADLEGQDGEVKRGIARNEAINTTLDRLDERALELSLEPRSLTAYEEGAISALGQADGGDELGGRLLEQLRTEADAALKRGPYSVTDKRTLPPSGDVHDYWHPAPYWWPNPETPDGLPYVRRDGERAPGTRMYEPESEKYDRTRLQRLFDDSAILTLAWRATGASEYAEHAAALVRRWFVAPQTRMNPHLRYAQVRMGHNDDQGDPSGLIEMKDLYYFLDAVRLLERAEVLDEDELSAFSEWLKEYLQWLLRSPQGRKERQAPNNHGACYDLQVGAIAAYLGDVPVLLSTLRDSHERLLEHFDPTGLQPHEMERSQTAHYCCFNLQSWVNLATLSERCGVDLWRFSGSDGRSLRRAFEWLLPYMGRAEWPWEQREPFDRDRYLPIYHPCRERYDYLTGTEAVAAPDRYAVKPIFFPHDGVKPFWMLG